MNQNDYNGKSELLPSDLIERKGKVSYVMQKAEDLYHQDQEAICCPVNFMRDQNTLDKMINSASSEFEIYINVFTNNK